MRIDAGASRSFAAIAVPAMLFYLALGGSASSFELVTGVISSSAVGILFLRTAFETPPKLRRSLARFARALLFLPYLCWEIMKANVTMAYLILHPALPIYPRLEQYNVPDGGPLELSTLATSITLTPGTLIVDVYEDGFEIHALTDAAWDGLLGGALERAVSFVFIGTAAFDEPTPRERIKELSTETDGGNR